MRNKPLLIGSGLVALIIVGAVGWWLISPLFITQTVDEAFPLNFPDQATIAQMSDAELQELQTDINAAIPSEEELVQMPETAQQALEGQVMEAAAAMPAQAVDEAMPAEAQPVAVLQGEFIDADNFHQGAGTATIYQLPNGNHIVRFENFEVTNGPNLHVLLASNPQPTSSADKGDYIDLGSLKGNAGNQNYEIPAGTDISQYQSIVIYCVPFQVVFSTATLG